MRESIKYYVFLDETLLNSKKEKYIFSPIIMTGIRTVFLSYNLAGKPRNSNKSTKMQNNI